MGAVHRGKPVFLWPRCFQQLLQRRPEPHEVVEGPPRSRDLAGSLGGLYAFFLLRRQLLKGDDKSGYELEHASLADYPLSDEAREADPNLCCDAQAQHLKVADYTLGRQLADGSWRDADSYVRMFLAAHAAEADRLDDLLEDPRFLLAADPSELVATFGAARQSECTSVWEWLLAVALISVAAVAAGSTRGPTVRAGTLGAAAGLIFGFTTAVTLSFSRLARDFGLTGLLAHWQPWALTPLGLASVLLIPKRLSGRRAGRDLARRCRVARTTGYSIRRSPGSRRTQTAHS